MGVVWAATHLVTRKPVALKALRPAYANDKQVIQRFLREARAACAVRHPNVVEIHDVLELDDGVPVMVMDLLEGESLGQRLLRDPRIPLPELATLLLPVVSAVGTAHTLGIVHRDLKPDNIFLSHTPTGIDVKVLDFGIAKLTATDGEAASTAGLTGTGAMLGTPYYMAPEQIYGEKDVDNRVDVWAIGVILYECLAGVRPTQAESIGQILRIVTRDGIKPLRSHCPDLPPEILELVDAMLTADRSKRPASLGAVADVLNRFATTPLITTSPRGYAYAPAAGLPQTPAEAQIGDAATIAASSPSSPSPSTLSASTTSVARRGPASLSARIGIGAALAAVLAGGAWYGIHASSAQTGTGSPTATVTTSAAAEPTTGASLPPPPPTTEPTTVTTTLASPPPSATATASTRRPDPTHKPVGTGTATNVAPPTTATGTASAATSATSHTPGGVVDKPPF